MLSSADVCGQILVADAYPFLFPAALHAPLHKSSQAIWSLVEVPNTSFIPESLLALRPTPIRCGLSAVAYSVYSQVRIVSAGGLQQERKDVVS
jgi:hypothetical protein